MASFDHLLADADMARAIAHLGAQVRASDGAANAANAIIALLRPATQGISVANIRPPIDADLQPARTAM